MLSRSLALHQGWKTPAHHSRSSCSNTVRRERSSLWNGLSLSRSSFSRMAAFAVA